MHKISNLPNHKPAIARCFSSAAKSYNEAAFLEQEVGNRLLSRLDYIKQDPSSILDLGGGTGIFSEQLALRYPKATIFNLDLAEGMLQQARTALQSNPQRSNIRMLVGDAENLPLANQSIDFIFSNCVFHWCYDISKLFKELQRVLKPEGLLLFSTLGPDTLKELRECFYLIDSNAHVNNFRDMHIVGDALLQAAFLDPVMDMEPLVLTYPTVARLIDDIKKSGSTYVLRDYYAGLSPKYLYQQLCNNYEKFKLYPGQLPATIEIVYGHAWSNAASFSKEENVYYSISVTKNPTMNKLI